MLIPSPEGSVETFIITIVQWLKLVVETIGAAIITLGVTLAISKFLHSILRGETSDYNQIRLKLARYLALALEFQLGADILSTAVAPSWDQIGKLGAIAIIRTGLNYFLMREMEMERQRTHSNIPVAGSSDSPVDRVADPLRGCFKRIGRLR
jgi:uncharacterized membrane protein